MNAGLILHCGCESVTLNDLIDVPTPKPTETWRPVSHFEVANRIKEEAENRGMKIAKEEYGISPDKNRIYAYLNFDDGGNPEYSRSLAWRNSHSKTFALTMAIGVQVFVCDNNCIAGDIQTTRRRHTSGIDIDSFIPQVFSTFPERYEKLEKNIVAMKETRITDDVARVIIVQCAEVDAIPSCDIVPILKDYLQPGHEEFKDRTLWSLYNSFTERSKVYVPSRGIKCYNRLSEVFGLQK